jgi:hypothetical protein
MSSTDFYCKDEKNEMNHQENYQNIWWRKFPLFSISKMRWWRVLQRTILFLEQIPIFSRADFADFLLINAL